MQKQDNSRRDEPSLSYLYTERALRESEAYRGLTKTAMLVLADFHGKKQVKGSGRKWTMLNNGELTYSYKEAESRGIPRSSFMRALDHLIERGFLEVACQGGGLKGDASKYRLISAWRRYGRPDFKVAPRKKRKAQFPKHGFQQGHPHYAPKEGDGDL